MTTTEPTTQTAAWIDSLVPAEQREEGHLLLAEVAAIRDQLAPLLDRLGRALADHEIACREAQMQVEEAVGTEAARDASDGLGELIGRLNGATALHGALSDVGIDPDALLYRAEHPGPGH